MITADLIDKIAPYLMAASDELEEQGDTDCELLRKIVTPYEEPEWVVDFRNEFHAKWGMWLQMSGSRLIAPGSVTDKSDWDFFATASPTWEAAQSHNGWQLSHDYPESPFLCHRSVNAAHDINLIIFSSDATGSAYYGRFAIATELCKQMRVTSKLDRVAIFQTIMYGSTYKLSKAVNLPWAK